MEFPCSQILQDSDRPRGGIEALRVSYKQATASFVLFATKSTILNNNTCGMQKTELGRTAAL